MYGKAGCFLKVGRLFPGRVVVFCLLLAGSTASGCFSLTREGYRSWWAERFAPATLAEEHLTLEFDETGVRVFVSFLFRNERQGVMLCQFPGRGYPVKHGLAGVPAMIPETPGQMTVHVSHGESLNIGSPALHALPLRPVDSPAGDTLEFLVECTNLMTRVDIRYHNRWHRLADGRQVFVYILTSGALWRGPIGSLAVTERGRRAHGVERIWPTDIPRTRLEPDFDLVYERRISASDERERE